MGEVNALPRRVFSEVVRLNVVLMTRSWMTWLFLGLLAAAVGIGGWLGSRPAGDEGVQFAVEDAAGLGVERYLDAAPPGSAGPVLRVGRAGQSWTVDFAYPEGSGPDRGAEALAVAAVERAAVAALAGSDIVGEAAERVVVSSLPDVPTAPAAGMLALFGAYLFSVLCGGLISTHVALERTSRVEEIVLTRLTATRLAAAKFLALGTLVALTVAVLAAEVLALSAVGVIQPGRLLDAIGAGDLTAGNWALIGAAALAGIVLYSLLYGVAGTFVEDQGELQLAQLPITLVLLPSFVAAMMAVEAPAGGLAHWLAFVPTTSPFVVGSRVIAGVASGGEIVGSALALAVACLGVGAILRWRLIQPAGGRARRFHPSLRKESI
jgi:hypothetical protein